MTMVGAQQACLPEQIARAVACLRAGGVVAIPTETVYGLGADARNADAVRRVFAIKGRPADHPLIVHVAGAEQVGDWAVLSPLARQLMARFWPGPLTLVLPARDEVPREVTGGQDSVALRAPSHPLAQALLVAFGGGLAAPSANRFGAVSPTEAQHVRDSLGDAVDSILDGGPCRFGVESTIVSLLGERPRILRPGALPVAALREALGADGIDCAGSARAPRVPGALAAHYAPATPLEIVDAAALPARAEALLKQGQRIAVLRLDRPQGERLAASPLRGLRLDRPDRLALLPAADEFLLPAQPEGYAHDLYARLREIDRMGFDRLLVEAPPADEAWWAVNDRLARAAAGSQEF